MYKFRFIFIIMLYGMLASAQYKIYDKELSSITLDNLINNVSDADVVFFGEQHDDTLAHKAQYDVLVGLFKVRNGNIILSMEMFETDVQYILDEYLNNQIIEQSFIKDARAWDNYSKDYKPMVEFMKQKNGKVVAANAPRRYVRMVSRQGIQILEKLDKNAKSFVAKLPIKASEGRYLDKFNKVMGGHMGGLSNIYHAQCVWDATMAESIKKTLKKNKGSTILHLCGKFHCEENLGTVEQLTNKVKKIKIKNIVAMKLQEFNGLTEAEKKERADYIIVTD